MEWIYHILSIHSIINGHFSSFRLLAVMNKAAGGLQGQVIVWTFALISLGMHGGFYGNCV